jgi:O-antigen/teichoic acid export membrane protein
VTTRVVYRSQRRSASLVRRAFVLDSENLNARVVHGASFLFLGIALRTLLTVGSVAILARLLTPEDFGYIAMATVITEFAALLAGFGFGNILIQRPVVTRLQLDTVFWTSAGIGACLAGLVFTLSYIGSWLFSEPLTGELLRLLSLSFLFNGLTTVHETVIARLMRFRTEFWIQIITAANRALAAIVFAYLGFGVWSLVIGALAGSLTSLTLNWLAVPYIPRLRYQGAYLTSTWRTSSSYLGHGFVHYVAVTLDLTLVGRSLGASALGYYQTARSLTDEIRARSLGAYRRRCCERGVC